MRFRSGLLIAFVLAITGYSCKHKVGKHLNQGEIHYSIDYLGNTGLLPREVMPKNLVVSFKDDKILYDISAPFGNSGILNLSNPESEIYDTYISLLTWRYYYSAKQGEIYPGFEAMKGIKIKKNDATAVICGFNCKSADVTFPDDRNKIYTIWYTNDINVKNPNGGTPFREIDGVLMKFFFILGPVEMHFDAETVFKKEISDKTFERREKYLKISREELDRFIRKMTTI